MASFEQSRRGSPRAVLVAALLIHAGVAQVALAQEPALGKAEYSWSAELVRFDAASDTVTVRARIDAHADVADLDQLDEGDRITLTWTGMTWGAGINGIYREQPSDAGKDLTLPAEFVRTEMDGHYVVFRLPVPQTAAANLQGLEQGEWVTATTPRNVSESSEAVTDIRPYNDVDDAS